MQALTAAMAGWVELRGPTRASRPRRLVKPDPVAAPLTLAPAAQRTDWVDVVVPGGVEKGREFNFAYGGVLYKVRAAVAAGQTMRLPALMSADEGGGAAAAAEAAAVASAVAGAGAGEGTGAGARAGAEVVVRVNRVTRRRRAQGAYWRRIKQNTRTGDGR